MIIDGTELDWFLSNFRKNSSHRNMQNLSLAQKIYMMSNVIFTPKGFTPNLDNESLVCLQLQEILYHKESLFSKYCN